MTEGPECLNVRGCARNRPLRSTTVLRRISVVEKRVRELQAVATDSTR